MTVPADGFCPYCAALDDQTCVDKEGRPRSDHKGRHPSPARQPKAREAQ